MEVIDEYLAVRSQAVRAEAAAAMLVQKITRAANALGGGVPNAWKEQGFSSLPPLQQDRMRFRGAMLDYWPAYDEVENALLAYWNAVAKADDLYEQIPMHLRDGISRLP